MSQWPLVTKLEALASGLRKVQLRLEGNRIGSTVWVSPKQGEVKGQFNEVCIILKYFKELT